MNNFIHEDYIADLNICDGLIKWFHSNKKYHHKGAFGSVDGTPEVDIKKKHSTDISFDIEEAAEVAVVAAYNKELQIILDRYLEIYHFASMVDTFKIVETVNIQHYKPTEGYRTFHSERTSKAYDMMRYLVFQTYLFLPFFLLLAVKRKQHQMIFSLGLLNTRDRKYLTGWHAMPAIL